MPSAWMTLDLHHKHKSIPPLLIKYKFGSADYKVWLTDLSYIWTESLERKEICRRALNIDTSIDPSEDQTQRRLFLKGIEDALRQSPGTSLSVDRSNDIQQLTLHTTTSLPHPLQPLEWYIKLVLAPQPTFASEFVSPLLTQQLTAKAEKTSLLQQLKDKDNVISKLIEKMQGDGVDLAKVFPGAVSSKSGTGPNARRAVAKSIKGLAEFDEDQWQSQIAKHDGAPIDWGDFLSKVFDGDGEDNVEGLQVSECGEWWKELGPKDSQRETAAPAIPKPHAIQESRVEDEFQRQLTPPKPQARTPKRAPGFVMSTESKDPSSPGKKDLDEGGSTTDESDEDLQSSHSKPLPLRTDGAVANSTRNASNGIQSEPMDLDDDALTASPSSASEDDRAPAKTHSVPNLKPKLGKIGGKGKGGSSDTLVAPASKPELSKVGGKGKLGKIGGNVSVSSQSGGAASIEPHNSVSPTRGGRDQTAAPDTLEPERSRTVQRHTDPSPPRETSQERANRKREQLKRELEIKSQATIRKKRKF